MRALELKVPPPVVALVTGVLMWLVARYAPGLALRVPARHAVAGGVFAAGLVVSVLGVASFRRAGTTVNPTTPERASSLVTSGVYRLTRNPMYLGLSLALLAWAV